MFYPMLCWCRRVILQTTKFYHQILCTNNYLLKIQKAASLNNLLFLFIVLFECHSVGQKKNSRVLLMLVSKELAIFGANEKVLPVFIFPSFPLTF